MTWEANEIHPSNLAHHHPHSLRGDPAVLFLRLLLVAFSVPYLLSLVSSNGIRNLVILWSLFDGAISGLYGYEPDSFMRLLFNPHGLAKVFG